MRIAFDPTPLHAYFPLLDFPRVVKALGYDWLQLTPHPDFIPFFNHPRADDELVRDFAEACQREKVGISSLLPVLRWSGPDEQTREGAVHNWKRVIEIAQRLEVQTINTEFSGRGEKAEESERCFYRSLEELLPRIEKADIRLNIDPHPDDFVESGMEAIRIIRGANSKHLGFVYVASHTFHMGDNPEGIIRAAGKRLGAVYAADTFDHLRSHGLRYITNPPGSAARIHQHLKIGDGDVDWTELFGLLKSCGYTQRSDALIVSNVFAEDENYETVSRYQLKKIQTLLA